MLVSLKGDIMSIAILDYKQTHIRRLKYNDRKYSIGNWEYN